jgi:hypothetical protein
MTTAKILITRDDPTIPDCSTIYGPDWHAPLPKLRPKLSAKIGIRWDGGIEWPWATITRVLGDDVWLKIQNTEHSESHGIASGAELKARREHLHMIEDSEAKIEELAHNMGVLIRLIPLCDEVDRCALMNHPPSVENVRQWANKLHDLCIAATGVFFFVEPLLSGKDRDMRRETLDPRPKAQIKSIHDAAEIIRKSTRDEAPPSGPTRHF